ncbi:hypothetical protein N7509_010293 [Penicillium cosmopolitanum]|uniref:Uncharacterized protein n=1 Tax=Penicillium cosmopolitanum TaxID=1131564 RepID=A0A9W9VR34_9EURO|nr:uncharacterized protein N7509_010293 [Penicillium cosmopolitanum]KAJ5387752.1 hypothetical protein N7509_010293 [Penicillium cosmopolitanum]
MFFIRINGETTVFIELIFMKLKREIFSAFVIFNFMLVFLFSWLYLHGVRDLKRWLSKRKTEKGAGSSS